MAEEQITRVINETLKANSHEFGPVINRFKLYFQDAADLEQQLQDLNDKKIKELKAKLLEERDEKDGKSEKK